jgi:hypothetical protein
MQNDARLVVDVKVRPYVVTLGNIGFGSYGPFGNGLAGYLFCRVESAVELNPANSESNR